MGEAFSQAFGAMKTDRVAAKKAKDVSTSETLKIALNGCGGKLNSKWSVLFAPDMFIQMTLTGQLALLLLIQNIERAGLTVISANTDGVTTKYPKSFRDKFRKVVGDWEAATGFTTEESNYKALYMRDVSNYIAVKTNGDVKGKGIFSNPWSVEGRNVFKLHKNPANTIVTEAIVAFLKDGISIEKTIRECRDIKKFVTVRNVTGGAVTSDIKKKVEWSNAATRSERDNERMNIYLGKVVRLYYSTETRQAAMAYKNSRNKVPKSDGAKPLMNIPDELPSDIDYGWYIREAQSTLQQLGYQQRSLFDQEAA